MPTLEAKDTQAAQFRGESPFPALGTSPPHAHLDIHAAANPDEVHLISDDENLEKDFQKESIRLGFLTPIMDIEVDSNIQNAETWQDGPMSTAADNQSVDVDLESQAPSHPTPIEALSPASVRLLQNADTSVPTMSPDMGGLFIQRHNSHEDVMAEIKSAFRFAKMETIHCPNKITSSKANRGLSETAKPSYTCEPSAVVMPHEDLSSLPQQPAINTNKGDSPANHPLRKSTVPSKPGESLDPPGSPTLPIQDVSAAAGMNAKSSRSSPVVAIPDSNSRRPHSLQKATSSSRIRIKQPFPEVTQNTTIENLQDSTTATSQDSQELGSQPRQPSTVAGVSFSDVVSNCQSTSLKPKRKSSSSHISPREGFQRHLQSSTGSGRDSLDSEPQIPEPQNFCMPSSETYGGSSYVNDMQETNTEQILIKWGTDENGLLKGSVPQKHVPHGQGHKAEESPQKHQILSSQQQEPVKPPSPELMPVLCHVDAGGFQPSDQRLLAESQVAIQPDSRPSSQSLLQSSRSHLVIQATEFFPTQFSRLQHPFEPKQFNDNTKVKKSKSGQSHKTEVQKCTTSFIRQPIPLSKVAQAQQNLLKHNQEVEDILIECQSQKGIIERQQSELDNLKSSSVEYSKRIQSLDMEKESLKMKVKKFEQLAVKYKDHMNEVIVSQKKLLRDSQRIQKVETDIKISQEAYITREAHIKKLEHLLQEAKEFRAPAEKLFAAQQENDDLLKIVQDSSRTNQMLQADLDRSVIELGRERHNAAQLHKQLNAQSEAQKELIEHLKKTRSGIIDDLTKEDGILAKILSFESSAEAEFNKLLPIISDVKNHTQDFQPALLKLIENLYIKIENKLQSADGNGMILHESHLKYLEDLKEGLDQVRLDQETRNQLDHLIAELREAKAALGADLRSREVECKGMAARIVEFESELESCRGLLGAKSDELAIALALPRDDPEVRGRFHDLEGANKILLEQVNTVSRENATIQQELSSLRESSLQIEKQLHEVGERYSGAQSLIKKFAEEKKTYMSNAKLDIEKARQEVAKASSAARSEIMMRNDALVKTLEQRRTEAESQVRIVKEELKRLQDERVSCSASASLLQQELSACREENIQQASQIKQLEQQSIRLDALGQQEESLEYARAEITQLRTCLEDIRSEATESLSSALQISKDIENRLLKVDDLDLQTNALKEQNLNLQKMYDTLRESTGRFVRRESFHDRHDECINAMRNSRELEAPYWPTQANEESTGTNQLTGGITSSVSWPRNQAEVSTMQQLTHKPLKVANRSTNNIALQPSIVEPVSSHRDVPAYNLRQSTVTRTSHTTHETTVRVQTPIDEITPFSNFSPIQSCPPSSLTDVSPIMDHLESINSHGDLRKACAVIRAKKHAGSKVEQAQAVKDHTAPSFVQNTSSGSGRGQYPLSDQAPNRNNQLVGATKESVELKSIAREFQKESIAEKSSVPRKSSIILKSALKKTGCVPNPTRENPKLSKSGTVLKSVPVGRGVNKSQRRHAPELGYKRVASGQAPKSGGSIAQVNDSDRGPTSLEYQPPQNQHMNQFAQKSPLMPGPKRNERKRAASSVVGDGEGPKSAKAPRTSLHFKPAESDILDSHVISGSAQATVPSRSHY